MTGHPALQQAFGFVLRQSRIAAGLSQEKLALESELDRTFVSLLERGLRQPTLSTIFSLASALHVHPASLISRTVDVATTATPPRRS